MKASGLARPGGGRPLGRASSCPESSREPAVSANTGLLHAPWRPSGGVWAPSGLSGGRPRPSSAAARLFGHVRNVRRTGPTGRRGPQGGRESGGKSALEAPAAVAVGASVRHLLGHLPPLGFEILPPRPALHLGRIGPGGSERPADLALPCIDMFPIWDTLSANKTGRCPKWPRPK